MDRRPQEQVYHQRILNFVEQYKTSGHMLEVGIGIGIFMELADKRGWKIEGVDPSEATCQYVFERLQLPVHHGYLESVKFPQGRFDVISLRAIPISFMTRWLYSESRFTVKVW